MTDAEDWREGVADSLGLSAEEAAGMSVDDLRAALQRRMDETSADVLLAEAWRAAASSTDAELDERISRLDVELTALNAELDDIDPCFVAVPAHLAMRRKARPDDVVTIYRRIIHPGDSEIVAELPVPLDKTAIDVLRENDWELVGDVKRARIKHGTAFMEVRRASHDEATRLADALDAERQQDDPEAS